MIIDNNTKVLITGATSKLGFSLIEQLVEHKASIFASAKDKNSLQKIKDHFSKKISVETFLCDLTSQNQTEKLSEWMIEKNIDLLINNAGMGLYGPVIMHTIDEQLNIVRVNIDALTQLCLHFAKSKFDSRQKGVILNISSATDRLIFPTFSLYSSSKAYITHFSLSLHEELKSYGIKVLTASPGQIETDFQSKTSKGFYNKKKFWSISPERVSKQILKQIKKEIPYQCFPYWTKIFRTFFVMLGRTLTSKILKKTIKNRFINSKFFIC